ncbi:MAG: multiheme c-type cytochrome, partial [Myxococcota bacterium]
MVRVIAGAVIGLGVLGGAGFAVLAAAEGGAVPGVASGAGRAALPQLDGESHLGAAGCKGPICHTSADEQKNIYGDEWFLWHEEDNHSNAYRVLRSSESKRIARNLNSGKDPWQMRVCLDCHADNVPEELRGPKFQIANGVGCEACHGGSKRWLGTHDDGRTHAQNLADGMYPTDDPFSRAVLCISCHFGNKDKFVTHRIMGAGHPRMSFELQNFTNIQPPHFAIDED